MEKPAVRRDRLGTYDWLIEALETLGREGIGAVRVERLARYLGVTKGSFYWHFKDRPELLDRLLEHWETEMTDKIHAHVSHLDGKPAEQLLALLKHIDKQDLNRYDAAVRAWALYDKRAATVVTRVDAKRLEYVHTLFLEMGFPAEEAHIRSRMSYYYVVGEYTASISSIEKGAPEQRVEHVRLRHRLLTER